MKASLSRDDLEKWAANDLGFYGLDISRFSSVFIAEVMQLQVNRVIDTGRIMDEVQYLEGRRGSTSTRKAEVFKHPLLKGI